MRSKMLNMTPHPLTLRAADGSDTNLPPSGQIARVSTTPGTPTVIDGIPVPVLTPDVFGEVTGLPDPVEGTFLIVSAVVGTAVAGKRSDVLVLGTGPRDNPVRDEKGLVTAVTILKRV